MGLPPRSMAGEKPQMQGLKRWLAVAVGSTRCLFGFQHHGCLLLLRLYVKKALDTAKVSGSWALLPLLTDHILSCRRHWSLPTRSKGGRLTQGDAAQCYNHASMLIGSHLTRKCFAPLFPRLKEGILRDVFIQKAVVAWDHAPSNRIMVSLLLPGPMEADHSQRQPAHLNGAGAQARGTSRASSPWIHLKCYSYKGLPADVTSGPVLGLVLCLQLFCF